jgi:hypothetical protein
MQLQFRLLHHQPLSELSLPRRDVITDTHFQAHSERLVIEYYHRHYVLVLI